MTNILIPTDFTVNSLDIITAVVQHIPGKLNIFLFHAFDMPDSLIDAMQRTGVNSHYNLITEELRLKCKKLKTVCPDINIISFRLMFGSTVAAFKNYAEANDINAIVYPEDYVYIPVVRESVNPDRMFLKSNIVLLRNLVQKSKATDKKHSLVYAQ